MIRFTARIRGINAHGRRQLVLVLLLVALAFGTAVAYAQTDTPIPPTATNVMLVVPINPMFEQTNNWMATFAPIVAIGVGITLAMAIFGFIAKMIKSAF